MVPLDPKDYLGPPAAWVEQEGGGFTFYLFYLEPNRNRDGVTKPTRDTIMAAIVLLEYMLPISLSPIQTTATVTVRPSFAPVSELQLVVLNHMGWSFVS